MKTYVLSGIFLLLTGCGVKGPPVPPVTTIPGLTQSNDISGSDAVSATWLPDEADKTPAKKQGKKAR